MDPSNAVHLANADDGEDFLAGANSGRRETSKSPPMCLLYGHILAENQPPDDAASEKQDLYCSFEVNGEIHGGQENEHGKCVFDIYFSQDNRDYLVKLVFGAVIELADEEYSQQEEGELESDFHCDDGEETYEDYENDYDEEIFEDEQSDDLELTGYRVCNLYFPGDRYYVVRLVFEEEEGEDGFLEEEDEFLFKKLQRAAGISSDGGEEEEVPAIDDKSAGNLPEIESENSSKLMELKIEEHDDDVRIEHPKAAKGTENGINEDQSSGNFIDPLIILEQQDHLIARIVAV